jgi:Tfp pilus assembly protein PilF
MQRPTILVLISFLITGCGSPTEKSFHKKTIATQNISNINKKAKVNYYVVGINHLKKGNFQEAVINFEKQLKENPKDLRAYLMLGNIYMKANQLDSAKAVLELGIKLDPQNPEIYFSLAQCYDRLVDNQNAIEAIKKSASIYKAQNDEANFKKAVAVYKTLVNQQTTKLYET